ncbi:MAG: hypothetical protein ACFFBD_11005, partial [Candidatus Hodarchaeota archaeon]
MLYNYLLEIQHKDHFSKFSQNHSQVEIVLWCNSEYDIIELRGENNAIERALTDLEKEWGNVIQLFPEIGHVQLIFRFCGCTTSPLASIISKYNCFELPPVKYRFGRMVINLIVTAEDADRIIEEMKNEKPNMMVKMLQMSPLKNFFNPYPHYLPID